MNCTCCNKEMDDQNICPSCEMGKRINFELFKTDKDRKKSFEQYESDYLNRLKINKPRKISKDKPVLPQSELGDVSAFGVQLIIFTLFGVITGIILAISI